MKKIIIGLCLLMLAGCTAVNLLDKHTSSAYGWGENYEKGYISPHGEKYSTPQDYRKAYEHYLIADRLGDIRAKEKIVLLSSKLTPEQRTIIEERVKAMSMREIKKFYHVPYEYDRNHPRFNLSYK